MDSTARPKSSVFSPSLAKSNRQQPTPNKSTPTSRRYLRRSFPIIGSLSSSTPRSSPGDAFRRRQQQLQDAQDEKDQQHSQDMRCDTEAPVEQDDDASSMSSILQHPGETQTSSTATTTIATSADAATTEPLPGSALHFKQAQELSERLTRLLDQSTARRAQIAASRSHTSIPHGSAAFRLRTTETEYDLSPDRTARLGTPPNSLYSGTPSRGHPSLQEGESFQESDGLASPPFSVSPSVRHARSRQWLEQEKILRHNKALFERHASNLRDELASAAERMSHVQGTIVEHDIVDQEQGHEHEQERELEHEEDQGDLMDVLASDREHGLHTQQEIPIHENGDYDDQGYEIVDEEVSFKRPGLVPSSMQSNLVDLDTLLRDDYENGLEAHSSTLPPTPRVPVMQTLPPTPRVPVKQTHPPTPRVPVKQTLPQTPRIHVKQLESRSRTSTPKHGGYLPQTENTLLEVAKKTAAITEELRGVYSNLQELFSPETEAKLNGAMSVLSARKSGSGNRASNNSRLFGVEETIPNPVFETSSSSSLPRASPPLPPPLPQFPMTPKTPSIAKRKPAPLRPAVLPKVHRTPLPEQQQRHSSQVMKEQPSQVHKHDVPVAGLISNAESARRLYQSNSDAPVRKSVNGAQELMSPPKIPNTFSFEAETPRKRHQERFRRKLDGWKRIERRSQFAVPPLPAHANMFIPTSSSRQPLHTERRDLQVKQGQGDAFDYHNHNQGIEEEWEGEGEGEEEQYDSDRVEEEPFEPTLPIRDDRDDRNVHRERILEDLRAQVAREEELRQRRIRRSDGFESDEELLNHRRLSKRRREAAFWS